MQYSSTTKAIESKVFPGVRFTLRKMTEGRRLELRDKIGEPNKKLMSVLKAQDLISKQPEESRDYLKLGELQEEADQIANFEIGPGWIKWGLKTLEGLEVDGKPLGVADYLDWPSSLFNEIVKAIQDEATLNGEERKNLPLPTGSGAQEDGNQTNSTVRFAGNGGITEIGIAPSTIPSA